jgi:hypothetical protein
VPQVRTAMRVHGIATIAESSEVTPRATVRADEAGVRRSEAPGSAATFRGKKGVTNWFHIAIPNPSHVPVFHPETQTYDREWGQMVRLARVFVLSDRLPDFETEVKPKRGVVVNNILVQDGNIRKYVLHPHDIRWGETSSLSSKALVTNTWDLRDITGEYPTVLFGLCVSLQATFEETTEISFYGAGADFLLDVM